MLAFRLNKQATSRPHILINIRDIFHIIVKAMKGYFNSTKILHVTAVTQTLLSLSAPHTAPLDFVAGFDKILGALP